MPPQYSERTYGAAQLSHAKSKKNYHHLKQPLNAERQNCTCVSDVLRGSSKLLSESDGTSSADAAQASNKSHPNVLLRMAGTERAQINFQETLKKHHSESTAHVFAVPETCFSACS